MGNSGWLPEEIGIIVDQAGQVFCFEGEDLRLHVQRAIHKISVYSLVGLAAGRRQRLAQQTTSCCPGER